MATLEERVAVLEVQVQNVIMGNGRTHDVATQAMRAALDSQEAHRQNMAMLQALRETQLEQGNTLAEHGRRLDVMDGRLDTIDGRLDTIDGKLGVLTMGMHDIQLMLGHLIDREGGGTEATG